MSGQNHDSEKRPTLLIVEDTRTQAEQLRYLLEKNNYSVLVAENGEQAQAMLAENKPDLIISDIVMPEMDGYQLCKCIKLNERTKHIPVILLTSLSKSADVLEGLECGADYFITKPYSESYLLSSVEQILLNRKLYANDRVRIATEIMVGGESRLITTDQQQALSLLISTYEAAVKTNLELLEAQGALRDVNTRLEELVEEKTAALHGEIEEHRRSEVHVKHLNRILRAIRSVSELIVLEKDPERLVQETCRLMVDQRGYQGAAIILTDEEGVLRIYAVDSGEDSSDLTGSDSPAVLPACCDKARLQGGIFYVARDAQMCTSCEWFALHQGGDTTVTELKHDEKSYGYMVVSMDQIMAGDSENLSLLAEMAANLATAMHNIEQGKAVLRSEEEKKKIEAEFLQAQKMEAVGRLAGGVAHDYNNALTVIMGFTELAMDEVDPTEPLHANLEEVRNAARRAAGITRQLLAFARKQTIAPMVLNLNKSVKSILKMLQRLIGEDLSLVWSPGADLWSVKMDPSQLDQILANLCINARDAIAGVGKLTIETNTVTFDTAYCTDHHGFIPGEFVMLSVSDNGCGMDKEILENIFEPFFTTKSPDKGTGLGLSTVYGIVKQNNGFINVYSEPGEGTTIKIYLPRHVGDAVDIQRESTEEIPPGHGETVLVVEDDPSILKFAQRVLEELGYIVLPANRPKEATELVKEHTGGIHLLVTDVIMPEMNGLELVNSLQSLFPDLKHVFMSGYTSNTIAHHGVLDEGVHFVQKPFSKRDLGNAVRKALDEAKGST